MYYIINKIAIYPIKSLKPVGFLNTSRSAQLCWITRESNRAVAGFQQLILQTQAELNWGKQFS
jgi:hypothetical protein